MFKSIVVVKISNFALEYDNETKEQFEECILNNFVKRASLMPDAHSGYFAPIGSVIETEKIIVPQWIGFDIGCGVLALKLVDSNRFYEQICANKETIFKSVTSKIPMGVSLYNMNQDKKRAIFLEYKKLVCDFKKNIDYNHEDYKLLKSQITDNNFGTLGSGNHFIEIDFDSSFNIWIVIHSGSRNVGKKIAERYMEIAKCRSGYPGLDISSKEGIDYVRAMDFAIKYAQLNRLSMAYDVVDVIEKIIGEKLNFEVFANNSHNHAVICNDSSIIHRKGAVSAKKDEKGIIPANMRDGCFLVLGLGNYEFLFSSSHGAGRKFSRKVAKERIMFNDFCNQIQNVVCRRDESFIDEAPCAYKNIYDVMNMQKKSVLVVDHLTPLINFKG